MTTSGTESLLAPQIEGCTILVASGHYVNPMALRADDVRIEDIAHALGNQCRYSGHTREFYSVAQHSVLVAGLLEKAEEPREIVLYGLLHDAAEAYLVDLPRPLKRDSALGEAYQAAEERCLRAVMCHFGLHRPEPRCVREADLTLLATERRDLMPGDDVWAVIADVEPLPYIIAPWSPWLARARFLSEWGRLSGAGKQAARRALAEAINTRRCNGCGLPAKEWGPVCSGMTQGDFTHYHSPEWWERHV
jgi:hypothetical protein